MGKWLSYLFITLLFFTVFHGVFFLSTAQAQIKKTTRIELNDMRYPVSVATQSFITYDDDLRLSPEAVIERHENNLRGQRPSTLSSRLAAPDKGLWMVFSLSNNSPSENWVLDFGDVFDGRMGFIEAIEIYNGTTNETLVRYGIEGFSPVNEDSLQGTSISLKIGLNMPQIFAVYLKTSPNIAPTIVPTFLSESLYRANMGRISPLHDVFVISMLLAVGFFMALSAIQKNNQFLYFSAYFISIVVFLILLDQNFIITEFISFLIVNSTLIVPTIIGLIMTRRFFNMGMEQDIFEILFFTCFAILGLGFLISQFSSGYFGNAALYFIYIPLIFSHIFLCLVSFVKIPQERHSAIYIASGWLAGLIGVLFLFTSANGWLGDAVYMGPAFFIMAIPQAVLFGVASLSFITYHQKAEISSIARESRAAQALARLKQSRETADQTRLLRVIERERELMGDLREREIQRTQEMRSAKEAADEANRAKSAFLAVVSHEIRTPMNGVLGMLRLLKDSKMTKEQKEYIQTIQNSGDTMLALLNDILDFEKIESGNMQIEAIDFDMANLVNGVIMLMRGHAEEKDIALKAEIDPQFPSILRGDPSRLRQVLLNLVSNAVKFTSEGSVTIILKSSPIENSDHPDSRSIYCAVRDTGIGISEDAQKTLFDPFTQAESSIARKYGGTGLGLAICRRLIEAMGGEIHLNSATGQGSTFFFNLRMKVQEHGVIQSEETIDHYNADNRPFISPMRILIVEDNVMNQRVLQGFLRKDQHILTIFDNAEDALECLKYQRFDVIITDIGLKGMDGIAFAKALRQMDGESSQTTMIALSGNVSAEDRKEYAAAGMNGFLAKPLDPQALFETLLALDQGRSDEDKAAALVILERQSEEEENNTNFVEDDDFCDIDMDEDFDSFALALDDEHTNDFKTHVQTKLELKVESADQNDGQIDGAGEAQLKHDPNLFNPTLLAGLYDSLPVSDFNELIDSFLVTTNDLVASLIGLHQNQTDGQFDYKNILDKAHEIKGMTANFGLVGLSQLSTKIEIAIKEHNIDEIKKQIELLQSTNENAQAALKHWLAHN